MEDELLAKYTYFLGRTETEVHNMDSYKGVKLTFCGKDELGYGMYARLLKLEHDKMFLLHFDRDAGSRVTVQKTYWGNGYAVYKEYQELAKLRSSYMPDFNTDGFCIHTHQFGNVLLELLNDGDLLCVMASINV